MGLFWDLIQQNQISNQQRQSENLDQRVAWLEREVDRQNELINRLLDVLEKRFGQDIDGDGRIG
ncbi:MAG: hypothetical protein ACYTFG_18985 [Planctomycetota bacterium]|jgi:hypothetical protein